jgi:hypothetical protein
MSTSARLLIAFLIAVSPDAAQGAETKGRFVESAAELGIDFTHRHFGTGEKYMPENMGPGVAVLDYDGDGLLDVYFAQGIPLAGDERDPTAINRLFRQTPDGTFVDVTARAGVGDPGYGMGSSFGDYDRDGDLDLYVTNFGPNVLYRNRGDGTFEDVTATAGPDCPLWSVSSGFFDPDGDGDLDLYVTNYLDFAFDNHKWCGISQTGVRAYCHPDVYNAVPDCFYRNEGDGRFTEVSRDVGIVPTADGVGLGVAFADLDGDGHQDIYVANDAQMNYLYLGDGKGGFTESALLSGVGFNDTGAAESSMGVEIGDLDGDGLQDIFLTHLDEQTNTLYRNLGGGLFIDITQITGLASKSMAWVGFGTVFFDYDNDGDLDIVVANGHIIDNIELFDPVGPRRRSGSGDRPERRAHSCLGQQDGRPGTERGFSSGGRAEQPTGIWGSPGAQRGRPLPDPPCPQLIGLPLSRPARDPVWSGTRKAGGRAASRLAGGPEPALSVARPGFCLHALRKKGGADRSVDTALVSSALSKSPRSSPAHQTG